MSEGEDVKWVRECLDGNTRAFEPLVTKYEKVIYNTAFRMLNDTQDAEDVTQTSFIKAYENLRSFNPEYKFFSWIYRITLNESLNLLKQRKNHEQLNDTILSEDKSPEEIYNEQEVDGQVQRCLMKLKLDYRVVIILNHFQDLSYSEIGYVLEIPEKTVKSRLFTARQILKDMLLKKQVIHG